MQQSSCEIAPDCRACLRVPSLIAELAVKQTAFDKTYDSFESRLDVNGKVADSVGFERRSDALASAEGQAYSKVEDKLLNALELATFCKGMVDGKCGIARYVCVQPVILIDKNMALKE